MFQAGFLWWIVDRSPGQKHSLCLCCILASDFPSQGKEVLLWKGRPGSPTQGRGGGSDTVLLRMFLAGDDQQRTLNQCKAARTRSQRDAAACLSWWRTCMSHGNVPSLRTILPADGQQAPWTSCCTRGCEHGSSSPWCWYLCRGLSPPAGALLSAGSPGGLDAPRALTHAWRELAAGGGCCKYV